MYSLYSETCLLKSFLTNIYIQQINDHISAYTTPTHTLFGTVEDIARVFDRFKNQVRGLCVRGDIIISNSENARSRVYRI